MLLYLGLGCDGKVAKTVDVFRNRFPFLFRSNKVNRFFYFASFMTYWIPDLLGLIKTKLNDINFFIDKKQVKIDHLSNVIILNCFSRMGGISHEWSKNLKKKENKNKGFV